MLSRTITRIVLGAALLCATFAWAGWAYLHTVADPDRVEGVAAAVLADPAARLELAAPLADRIVTQTGIDPAYAPLIRDAAAGSMADPRVAANMTDALGSSHSQALGVPDDRPTTIDGTILVEGVRAQLAITHPDLAPLLPADAVGDIALPAVQPPFVAGLRTLAETITTWLALTAATLLLVCVATGDRKYTFVRYGLWAIVTGAFWVIAPYVAVLAVRKWAPGADSALSAAIGAATKTVTVAASILVVSGVGALVLRVFAGLDRADSHPSNRPARAQRAAGAVSRLGPSRRQSGAATRRTPVPAPRQSPARSPLDVEPTRVHPAAGTRPIADDSTPRPTPPASPVDEIDPWAMYSGPAPATGSDPSDGPTRTGEPAAPQR